MAIGVLLAGGPAMAEPRVALVIGNGKYGQEIGSLINPPNDANLMAERLKALGFTVTKLINGDQKAMKRAIVDFGQQLAEAGPDAVGLFFYAGHGISVDGYNYLIPVAAQLTREADAEIEAVNAEWVLKQMQFASNRVNIVILDACRNNPLSRGMRSANRGLSRMDAPTGSFIGYSTAPGEVAADGGGKNSPYTAALAAEMAKPGVAIEEAFRNVRVKVMANTDAQQVPWESSSLTGAFFFQPGAKAATASQPAAKPAAEASQTEQIFWQSIQNSQDPSEFDAYINRFPDGAFVDLAHAKIARLRNMPPKVAERSSEAPAKIKLAAAAPEPEPEPEPAPQESAPPESASEAPSQDVASIEPPAPVENSDPNGVFQITAKVEGMLKVYLSHLQNRKGAFAVSPDGTAAGSFVCQDMFICVPGKRSSPQNQDRLLPQKRARLKCESQTNQACIILMVQDDAKRPYVVSGQ
jgi:carboxyl-terminal processing protease